MGIDGDGISRDPRWMLMVAGLPGKSLQLQFAHGFLPAALSRSKLAQMHVLASEAGSRHSDAAYDQTE
jgi:hypothetical protein